MTNAINLQQRINLIAKDHKNDIKISIEELIHEQYRRRALWMNLDDLHYYDGNDITIEKKVMGYLSNYHSDLFRPIEVCLMNDGEYHIEGDNIIIDSGDAIILNGHHRKAMLVILGISKIPVVIRNDIKTHEDLTEYYLRLNRSLKEEKKSSENMHKNGSLIAGSVDEFIDSINEKYGISFATFKADNCLRCVEACKNIIRKFGRFNYDITMKILIEAFDGDPDSLTEVIVRNISRHLKENEGFLAIDGWLESYIKHLQEVPAAEWNKRWTPPKSQRLARKDLSNLRKAVAKDVGTTPRSYKNNSSSK